MGSGIAQVFAASGYSVTMIDIAPAQLQRGLATIESSTQRTVARGGLDQGDRRLLLSRITMSSELASAAEAALVIEAIVESCTAKQELLSELDLLAQPGALVASNTSSISISQLGARLSRPQRFIGMHFVNPVPVMPLVEVIRGLETSDETHATAVALVESLGKTPVSVGDSPGFALNRLLIPMLNEAAYLLMEGVASAEEIDAVMTLGARHPMGPLALTDLIGLDVCLSIMQVLHSELGEDKYRPCPLLRRMVSAGHLGRKVGRGFFIYDGAGSAGH